MGCRPATIHFMGAWDTVASMITPRPNRLYLPSLRTLPFTRRNPSVRTLRHAVAIDERRRMFRLNRWIEPQEFLVSSFGRPASGQPQDVEQRWFPGVHADIGGGYPEAESGLPKAPLIWMAEEASEHGLLIDERLLDRLGRGLHQGEGRRRCVAPDPAGRLHRSLHGIWWLLEVLPRLSTRREAAARGRGIYLPLGERRTAPPGAVIDPSTYRRMASIPAYRPSVQPEEDVLATSGEEVESR